MNFTYQLNKNEVTGKFGLYTFEAKLNGKPLQEGIANGRVVELSVYSGGLKMIHYDHGWKRGSNFMSLIQRLVPEIEKVKLSKLQMIKQLVGGIK